MERIKTTIAIITAVLIAFIVFTSCNTVDENVSHIAKWVTIDGDDYDPNVDCYAPLFNCSIPLFYDEDIIGVDVDTNGDIGIITTVGVTTYFKREDSKWVDVEGRTPYDILNSDIWLLELRSPPLLDCRYIELKIDNDGYPHILAEYGRDIAYMRWNGIEWVNIHGEKIFYNNQHNAELGFVGEDNSCAHGELQLDSTNYPHIYWTTAGDINYHNYVYWDGEKWLTADGSEYTPDGLEHIITEDEDTQDISYAKMVLGPDEQPHIYLIDIDFRYNKEQREYRVITYYMQFNGDRWSNLGFDTDKYQIGININNFDSDLSFDLDQSGDPIFAWNNGIYPNRITIVRSDGKQLRTLDGNEFNGENAYLSFFEGNVESNPPVVKIGKNGDLHLLWHDSGIIYTEDDFYRTDQRIYYARYDGCNWFTIDGRIIDPISGGSGVVSLITAKRYYHESVDKMLLFVDRNNMPHIFWKISASYLYDNYDSYHYVRGIPVK